MRLAGFVAAGASVAFVSPIEWTYQRGYRDFRGHVLNSYHFSILAALGRNAFDYSVRASPVLCVFANDASPSRVPVIDASNQKFSEKSVALATGDVSFVDEAEWSTAPDQRILLTHDVAPDHDYVLGDFAEVRAGSYVGDAEQFERFFWEVHDFRRSFEFLQSSVSQTTSYGGRERAILWEQESGQMARLVDSVKHLNHAAQNWRRGKPSWGRKGVALSLMGELPATIYTGEIYDKDCCAIVPKNAEDTPALIELFLSGHFSQELRKLDKSLKVDSPKTLLSVPCDIEYWREKASRNHVDPFPVPTILPPTQWIFSGNPAASTEPVGSAVARLVGYRWPRQNGSSFVGCPEVVGDKLEALSDREGIVCLAAFKGEAPAEQRLSAVLAASFDSEWSAARLATTLAGMGYAGRTLDDWLRDGFFAQHCELFHQRPFIWHIWDGRRDGFHALVNYHRLAAPNGDGRRTLEKLIYSYLGEWIDRQRADQKTGAEGADARLAHAEHLRAELIKILEGEPPYDIFVRWKPLHRQTIGWDPDINDGVRMNIRPFMTARPLGAKAKGACILRATPKIRWDKDRGKEPDRDKADYPWFWGWDGASGDFAGGATFDGNRWNDLHYSRSVRQAARDRHAAKAGTKP